MTHRAKAAFRSVLPGVLAVLLSGARRGDAQVPMQRVAIAAHALARGAVVTATDIVYRDTVIHAPTDTGQVAPGWVTRRMIAAGELLRVPAVSPPILVTANQTVDIEWADHNISLTLRGVVTRSASLGERVIVRTEHGRRVEATVVAAGRVRLD